MKRTAKTKATIPAYHAGYMKKIRDLFPKVNSVEDSNEGVIVTVTDHDGKVGKKNKFSECALAVACQRELKADGVIIGLTKSFLIYGTKAIRYQTPQSVAREMTSFDRHGDFAAGVYKLSKIGVYDRIGVRRKTRPKSEPSKQHREIRFRHDTAGVRRVES